MDKITESFNAAKASLNNIIAETEPSFKPEGEKDNKQPQQNIDPKETPSQGK